MESINQSAWELKADQPYNMNKIWLILKAENTHKLSIK